ncbi:hypothetical protein ES705_19473 [subsurface metagenome]
MKLIEIIGLEKKTRSTFRKSRYKGGRRSFGS